MDMKIPGKSEGSRVVSKRSSIKRPGKAAMGFQSFKLVNSNIKLVRQELKTSASRARAQAEIARAQAEMGNTATLQPPPSPVNLLGTSDKLRQMRENFQAKKKLHEELSASSGTNSPAKSDSIPNGIHPKQDTNPSTTVLPRDSHPEESVLKSSKSDSSPTRLTSKRDRKWRLDEKNDGRSTRSELSATSSSRSQKKPEPRKNRERSRSPRREDSRSSRRHSSHDRSRSPRREKQSHASSKRNSSTDDKSSSSPHRTKELYSSSKSTSKRSSHHRKEKTSARKYSTSSQPRESESSKSNSHGHHSDRRRLHDEDSKYEKRSSSSHRKSSPERKGSSSKKSSKTTDSSSREYSSSKKGNSTRASKSPEKLRKRNSSTLKSFHASKDLTKTEKSRDTEGLFSKLSFHVSINEEEEYELENGSPDFGPDQDRIKDSEAPSVVRDMKTEGDSDSENVSNDFKPQGEVEAIVKEGGNNEISSFHDIAGTETSAHGELSPAPIQQPMYDEFESNLGGDTPCQDERDSDSYVLYEEMNSSVDYGTPTDSPIFEDTSSKALSPFNNKHLFPKTSSASPVLQCVFSEASEASTLLSQCTSLTTSPLKLELSFKSSAPNVLNKCMTPKHSSPGSLSPKTPTATPVNKWVASQELSVTNGTSSTKSLSANDLPDEPVADTAGDDTCNVKTDLNGIDSSTHVNYGLSAISNSFHEVCTQPLPETSPRPATAEILPILNDEKDSVSEVVAQNSCNLVSNVANSTTSSTETHRRSDLLSPKSDAVLLPDSKTLSSEAKKIYQSILKVDLRPEDALNISGLHNLNGVISLNKTETFSGDHDSGMGPREDTVNKVLIKPDSTEKSDKKDSVEVSSCDTLQINKKPECQEVVVSSSILGDASASNVRGTEATNVTGQKEQSSLAGTPVVCGMNLATHFSPKTTQYKLKLHATTKTPLPAKKSYIRQQVQSDSEKAFEPGFHSLVLKRPSQSDSDTGAPVSISDAEGKDSMISLTPQMDDAEVGTQDRQNVPSVMPLAAIASDTGLPRQDSSGSSTNDIDNEEGPRRSARIRTKKTGRTLKRLSVETPLQTQQSIDARKEAPENTLEPIAYPHVAESRFLRDLSGEDLFKARINLATDVADDCPDLFELLDENLYLTSLKKSRARKEIRRMVCDCALEDNPDPGGPCGDSCLNRLLMIECSSRCLYEDKCTNKRFQHRNYAPTEVFKTGFKGWGIRASCYIEPGQLIMEYCGEVVDQREFTRRSLEYSKSNHAHFYFMALSQDEVIDATYKGNSSRFINHSCDPNAETQKWTVNGRLRVGFFTVKHIQKGEEITFDYQFERYGKVAQKCYCGTAKCRGYLGKAPNEEESNANLSRLLSNEALSLHEDEANNDSQDKETRKNKKLALFTDNTMEKDISKLSGGLRSSKEVLSLSRLMVRCDTQAQRIMCLQVLKETTSQTRLKTFLQFHGLSIIWSWMVDISGVESQDAFALKMEIINTLCTLPITCKNVIEDSKVLSVVQRWAKPESEAAKTEESKELPGDESNNEKALVKEEPGEKEPVATIVSTTDETTNTEEGEAKVEKEPSADESQAPDAATGNEKVVEAALSLLESWRDLREIYRIPKRQKPLSSPTRSRDNSVSRTSSPRQLARTEDGDSKASRNSRSRRDSSQELFRDGFNRSWDPDNQFSPGSSNSGENRREPARRKRRLSAESDDGSRESGNVPWHCRPPKHCTKMSRQEYRRRFEKGIEKREQEKKRLEEQMEAEVAQSVMYPINNQQFIGGMDDEPQPLMGSDIGMLGPALPGNSTFTQSGFSGNLIQINPIQPAPLMAEPYMNVAVPQQQMGLIPQVIQHPAQNPYTLQMSQNFNVSGVYNQDLNLQGGLSAGYPVADQCMQNQQQMIDQSMLNQQQMIMMGQQVIGHTVSLLQPQQPTMMQFQQQPVQTQQPQASNVTILGSQNGQAIVLLTAEQLQKLTQGNSSAPSTKETEALKVESSGRTNTEVQKKSKSSKKEADKSSDKAPKKLPPRWKTATDPEGRTYYFHEISRQTQWDPPTWDGDEDDMQGKKDAEMDLSSTPTYDERRLKSSKNKGDEITEEGRKARDAFRLKMSHFVVQCLGSFRKPDQKVGRITSTEDFKHLARKLTHNVMQKEIKQVRVWEDLDFNANVKHKTKEYVKKYMSRVGPVYRIRDDT